MRPHGCVAATGPISGVGFPTSNTEPVKPVMKSVGFGNTFVTDAMVRVIGWSSWNDFKKSIDDFNQNVKPLIQQAKHDAQDASDAARSAKNQIKETTDEANRQLEAVKKSNGTIEELQRELKQLIE